MLVVKPLSKNYKIKMSSGEEEVIFTFHQLDYKTKSEISGLVTNIVQGQITIDATLQVFYNLKFGLKNIEGIVDEEGNPYKLQFEDNTKKCLTDECVDELLACELSDNIIYTARELSNAILPNAILHPLTKEPLAGVEVMPSEATAIKKKS